MATIKRDYKGINVRKDIKIKINGKETILKNQSFNDVFVLMNNYVIRTTNAFIRSHHFFSNCKPITSVASLELNGSDYTGDIYMELLEALAISFVDYQISRGGCINGEFQMKAKSKFSAIMNKINGQKHQGAKNAQSIDSEIQNQKGDKATTIADTISGNNTSLISTFNRDTSSMYGLVDLKIILEEFSKGLKNDTERKIFKLMEDGTKIIDISKALDIERHTILYHVKSIRKALKVVLKDSGINLEGIC